MTLRIAVTPGEPAGIGPDLLIQLAQEPQTHELVAVTDPKLLQQRAALLGLPLTLKTLDPDTPPAPPGKGVLTIDPVTLRQEVTPGTLDSRNGPFVLETLDRAIAGCQQHLFSALVTGPVNKATINEAGIHFSGHTEYLAEKTGRHRVVMMLATKGLRVAVATTHLPLREVADAITAELLEEIITIMDHDLRLHFGIGSPQIVISGLNPHAGEGGHLGMEEIEIIEPTLNRLRERGLHLVGPLPADTLFTPKYLDTADAVLAMYHDQGLPVLKFKGFGRGVNITLGLPFIRTSVDHGTALELVGTGTASTGSLKTAIQYACGMLSGDNHPV